MNGHFSRTAQGYFVSKNKHSMHRVWTRLSCDSDSQCSQTILQTPLGAYALQSDTVT